jgi:hypothetical protein
MNFTSRSGTPGAACAVTATLARSGVASDRTSKVSAVWTTCSTPTPSVMAL